MTFQASFDAGAIMDAARAAYDEQVLQKIDSISTGEVVPQAVIDVESEHIWDHPDAIHREEGRQEILKTVRGEAVASALRGILVIGEGQQKVLAILKQTEAGEWELACLEGPARLSMRDDDSVLELPPLPLRFAGDSGIYRIQPDGNTEKLSAMPEVWGYWESIEVSSTSALSFRLHAADSGEPVNEVAARTAKGHDVYGRLPSLEEDEGPLVIYGDAFVEEFSD